MELTQDDKLISAYLTGDPKAVEAIREWVVLAAHPFQRRLDVPWEDLIQDLLLEIHTAVSADAFRGHSKLKTYVWRCVNNSCIDHLRSQTRRPARAEADAEQFPSGAAGPFDLTLAAESRKQLQAVLSRMSVACIELWRMLLDGKSYREMSEDLGVREGTLRVRVLRCRQHALATRDELGAEAGSAAPSSSLGGEE